MQLKEIIKNASLMLGKSDVVKYLDGDFSSDDDYDDGYYEEDGGIYGEEEIDTAGADTLEAVNLMVNLSNLVINELACTFIPLVAEEQIVFSNQKAYYKNFKKKVVKILGVFDLSGRKLDFIDKTEYILVNSALASTQTLMVEYQYSPDNYALTDEIGYSEMQISARTIAYGVASEVCISEGDFDQAVMHHKRCVDEIALITMPKNATIKQRSWR